MKAPGSTLPRVTSKKNLLKSQAEEHSSILFHNVLKEYIGCDNPYFCSKNVADFQSLTTGTEAPFFPVPRHATPIYRLPRVCIQVGYNSPKTIINTKIGNFLCLGVEVPTHF